MVAINGINIDDAVTGLSVREQVNSGAAVMSFTVLKSEAQKIENGDSAVLNCGVEPLFCGKVFSRELSRDTAEISALDSIRGLKAVFPVLRKQQPADEFIKTLLAIAAPDVKTGTVERLRAEVSEKRFEKLPLAELIYRALEEVEPTAGRYILRDEAGRVCLRNERSLETSLVLDGANVLDFSYQSSVEDAFNYVKLTSNSVENALSAAAVVSDEEAIAKWGRYSYVAEADEKNPEQLMLSAQALLKQKGRERQKLSVTAIGDARARAGCIVSVDLDGVGAFWARILSCEHSFSGKGYTMRLELERL